MKIIFIILLSLTLSGCFGLKKVDYYDLAQETAGAAIGYPLKTDPALTDQMLGIDDPTGTWAINRFALVDILELGGIYSGSDGDFYAAFKQNTTTMDYSDLAAGECALYFKSNEKLYFYCHDDVEVEIPLEGDDLGGATYTDVVALFTGDGDFLKADGTLADPPGDTMDYPGAGIAVSTGSAWGTSKTSPAGDIVGNSDTQELSNKTFGTGMTWPTFNQDTTGTAGGLSGTPALPDGTTATTQSAGDDSTKLATTAYVDSAVVTGSTGHTSTPTYSNTSCTVGEWSFDDDYYYLCKEEDSWDRFAITWLDWEALFGRYLEEGTTSRQLEDGTERTPEG